MSARSSRSQENSQQSFMSAIDTMVAAAREPKRAEEGGSEGNPKRRKIRKGTHSCWECRRRKIKCVFAAEDAKVCVTCQVRGSECLSQELAVQPPAPSRRLAQRLGRLEDMMSKLVENAAAPVSIPSTNSLSSAGTPATSTSSIISTQQYKYPTPPASSTSYLPSGDLGEHDLLESTAARNAHAIASSLIDCPHADEIILRSRMMHPKYQKYLPLSEQLHALLPCKEAREILCQSPGAHFIFKVYYPQKNKPDDRAISPESLMQIPPSTAHPALIARRLIQYAICIQHLPPFLYTTRLSSLLGKLPASAMSEWVSAVATHITPNDDLISNQEGLEAMILHATFLGDLGHLRKSWMTTRRAISMCQMMGLQGRPTLALRSCDPGSDEATRLSPESLWFRVICNDRYLSLILGLPIGTRDDSFATDEHTREDVARDKTCKKYAVMMKTMCERNENLGPEAYAITQRLDREIEAQVKEFENFIPMEGMDKLGCINTDLPTSRESIEARHYTLLLMNHLPYVLRAKEDGRYEYNRATCLMASRKILHTFLSFRAGCMSLLSGRQIDYSALIASMTLVLGQTGQSDKERRAAIQLVSEVRDKMEQMAAGEVEDKLSRESADILGEILSFMGQCNSGKGGGVQINVPFLGRVNLGDVNRASTKDATPDQDHQWDTGIKQREHLPQCEVQGDTTAASCSQTKPSPAFPSFFSIDPQTQGLDASGHVLNGTGDMHLANFDAMEWPDFLAEPSDWALQGVDASYWNLVSQGYNFQP